jgi:glycolate oxidase FAD binding subunit
MAVVRRALRHAATISAMSALLALTDRIRAAHADGTALRIRGGGSKDFYGERLQGEILDTRAYNGIVSYEPSELVVTVNAGTPLAELEAALAAQGQCLPFEPPRFVVRFDSDRTASVATQASNRATVGGMVAAGLSGPARASVGSVRDYVLGVQMVNGMGEQLTFGGTVMKNVAGYDVSRLMAGSLGTLGLITQVSLKVLPVAPAQATLVFDMAQDEALAQINHWGGEPLPLNASSWQHADGRAQLHVRLCGAVAAVEAACKKMLTQCGGLRLDSAAAQETWTHCRDHQSLFFTETPSDSAVLWRISVPQSAPALALPHTQLIEWHGAQRWLWAAPDDAAQVRAAAHAAYGYATKFIAACAREYWANNVFDALKPPLDKIHLQLKAQLDPKGIFNRGRMFADF